MTIPFEKYQGTGNDFIIIDDRDLFFPESDISLVQHLCDRKFGIGSDGLMLIRNSSEDFEMIFYNPDGSKSLCGNGSRCAVHYSRKLGLASNSGSFKTTDGRHNYKITDESIAIQLHDIEGHQTILNHLFIDTGSPHMVIEFSDLDHIDIIEEGRSYRNRKEFSSMGGSNVNFISLNPDQSINVRTYERGVENETLSCGTGVTAVALTIGEKYNLNVPITLHTMGGKLNVSFKMRNSRFTDIWLEGPAEFVFKGTIDVK